MRKYFIGFILGVAVTAAGSAYADEIQSLIGKTIEGQFPVKIEGKQLDTQAAVVDGTSYLPVRAIGEALNMDVQFDADLGIELKGKGVANVDVSQEQKDQMIRMQKIEDLTKELNELLPSLDSLNAKLYPYEHDTALETKFGKKDKDEFYQDNVSTRDDLQSKYDKIKKELDDTIKEQNDYAELKRKQILSQP